MQVLQGLGASCWGDQSEWIWGQQLESHQGCGHPWPVVSATGASGVSVPPTGVSGGLSPSHLGGNGVRPANQLLGEWGRHD